MRKIEKYRFEKMQITNHKDLDTKDKIRAYFIEKDEVKLTATEKKIKDRWTAAFSMLCNFHSPQQTATAIQKQFGITERQAFLDINHATEVFGDVHKSNKEGYKHILFEYCMKVLQLAAKYGNLSEMNKAINNMIQIKGLDTDEAGIPDFSAIQNNQYNISIPDEALKLIMNATKGSVIDTTKLLSGNSD